MKQFHKIAIVGCGPGGWSCAIQLKRYQLDHVVFEKNQVGGLACNANNIINLAGFKSGITGLEFTGNMQKQTLENALDINYQEVLKIDYDNQNDHFKLKTKSGLYHSEILVLANGSRPLLPEFKFPKQSRRIFTEYYPVRKESGKKIVIIGGGDIALDYALSFSQNNHVTLLNRSKKLKALPVLIEECLKSKTIDIKKCSVVKHVEEQKEGLKIFLKNSNDYIKSDILVLAIGRNANWDILTNNLLEEQNKIMRDERFFIIGDSREKSLRQISIASGEGLKAAIQIEKRLNR